MTVLTWVGIGGAFVGGLTAIGLFIRGVWRLVRRIVHISDAVTQLKPNGGSSMYDKVNKMHITVQDLVDRVEKLENKRWIKF